MSICALKKTWLIYVQKIINAKTNDNDFFFTSLFTTKKRNYNPHSKCKKENER